MHRSSRFRRLALSLALLPVLSAMAQEAPPAATVEGARTYTPADFARYAPRNALDMLEQVPGFQIREADIERGLGEATGNVLINGQRVSGKSNDVITQLGKIPAGEHFDLLLLHIASSRDISAEIEGCVNTVPAIYRSLPKVIYSDCAGAEDIAAAINGGARGYLPSSLDSEQIVEALRLLASGLAVFPPAAVTCLADSRNAAWMAGPSEGGAAGDPFTVREREVLEGLHAGKPNKTIARDLGLSQSTVKVHVRSVFRKLGVHNRTEAAILSGEHLAPRPNL